jgi:hypothetical protein
LSKGFTIEQLFERVYLIFEFGCFLFLHWFFDWI